MIAPTVHLNGTSADELLRQLREADSAVCAALKALHDAAPNGRDFYPQGPGAYGTAAAEHRQLIDKLVDVRTALHARETAIDEQVPRCRQCGPAHVRPGTDVCERHGKRIH